MSAAWRRTDGTRAIAASSARIAVVARAGRSPMNSAKVPIINAPSAGDPMLIAALILAGMCFGSIIPVASAVPSEIKAVGPALAGTGVGVMFMIGNTGGFLGPVMSGWLIDTFGTPWAGYGFVTVAAAIAIVLAAKMSETGRAAQN